ncbi:transporter [Chitinophaga rhizophila]|uniref:Transporter n=1 Tax=Chitinophaga rhizophila TaxID=2866212 RepID=A0ABS7GAJ7_9BACT|nr:transporter [Chitinophaga rhizophila]MBW8684679.1 transporter [Chitinophaga rhizophila]
MISSIKTTIFQALILLCISTFARAQDKINTDRPDQTDGATVIDPKSIQFETEFYYNKFSTGEKALISSSLLRYGLTKKVEARLLVEQGQERDLFISETTQGQYPLALSTKIAVLKDKRNLPDIALIGYLHLPLTSHKGNYGYWSPSATLVIEKEFDKLTATANGTYKQEAFEKEWIWQVSGDLKYELSERISVFGEYFAQYAPGDSPLHNADGGILYHITPDWVVYLAMGHTLFTKESNYFGNAGLAFRIH